MKGSYLNDPCRGDRGGECDECAHGVPTCYECVDCKNAKASGIGAHKIKKVYIVGQGDESVGIHGGSAVIEADGDFLLDLGMFDDDGDRECALEEFRQDLVRTFSAAWDDHVGVEFDFEGEHHASMEKALDEEMRTAGEEKKLKTCSCGGMQFALWDDGHKWQVECLSCRRKGPKRVHEEDARSAWGYADKATNDH